MRLIRTNHFRREWKKLPSDIRQRAQKALRFLLANIRHPSLRAKIVDESKRIWQARANGGYRLYFQIRGSAYYLLDIEPHPK